jgi:hypothetical protein
MMWKLRREPMNVNASDMNSAASQPQHLYKLAKQFEWRTNKIGHTRLYHREDVEDTPGADERKRIGYEQRGKPADESSTRVEGGE